MTNTIEDVRRFWDSNPLLSGEIDEPVGTRNWFDKFDKIKTGDVFCGDLPDWIREGLDRKRVLDIGCGPGYWNRIFGKMNVEYHGIDISPKTVEVARVSQQLFALKGEISVGNAESLPFPDASFDYVLSEGVIHHTPDTQKCVDEIYRVLSKGGIASISLYHKSLMLRSPFLFSLAMRTMRLFRISLKGRSREQMAEAPNAEEFVRMYDGGKNPIGKSYTKRELRAMFSRFSSLEFKLYYFPSRALRFPLPRRLQKMLASCFGFMILVKARKAG